MSKKGLFRFQLYVAGDGLNSARAIANLSTICQAHLPDRHTIEIVDVYQHPERALADAIFMTPTLVRLAPGPEIKIVGTLSDVPIVLQSLGLEAIRV
jgi:circadian clock protein KaiB